MMIVSCVAFRVSRVCYWLLAIAAALLLLGCSSAAAATSIRGSELTQTNALNWSNLLFVVVYPYPHPNSTNSEGGTYSINASNLAVQLSQWITGVGGGDAGGTNARQFGSLLLSNLVLTGISPGATNAGFYVASTGGTGTNLDLWGGLEIFTGGLLVGGNVFLTNGLNVAGLTVLSDLLAQTAILSGAVTANTNVTVLGTNMARWLKPTGGVTNDRVAIITGDTNLSSHPNVTVTELTHLDGVTSALQTQLDGKQPLDADLTDLADGSLTGSKVGDGIDDDFVSFDDADNLWTATKIGPALEELNDSINAGSPNGTGAKVHWSQLLGVPAGFADNTDDGAGGGSLTTNANQFGPSVQLTIKDAATLTNLRHFNTNFFLSELHAAGRVWTTNGITSLGTQTNVANMFQEAAYTYITNVAQPSAPSAVPGGAGVNSGDYGWVVTFTTANGETAYSSSGGTELASESATVTIPVSSDTHVTGRNVYRNDGTGADPHFYFLTNIANNVDVSFNDNIPNSALVTSRRPPEDNTTANAWFLNGSRIYFVSSSSMYMGPESGVSNMTGSADVSIGRHSMRYKRGGVGNVAVGDQAMMSALGANGSAGIVNGAFRYATNVILSVAVGQDALGADTNTVAYSIAMGWDAGFQNQEGQWNVFLGTFAGESLWYGSNNVFIGGMAGPTLDTARLGMTNLNGVIAIGYKSQAPSNNVAVIGGDLGGEIHRLFIGSGVTNDSPGNVAIHATSGLGTDNRGAGLDLAAGQSTGAGSSGAIRFLTAGTGGSGSSLNALQPSLVVSNGAVYLPNLPTNTLLRVGAGGIISTGTIGANLQLNPDGTLSSGLGSSFWSWGGTNVQWRMVKNITLTNVADVSAAAYYPSNNTFFTVHNNNAGRITEWTLDGVNVRIINGTGAQVPDAESITYLGGNRFAVVDEDNNRFFLFSITNNASGSSWNTNDTEIIKVHTSVGVDGPSGIEGIAYDWDRFGWWVAREKTPAQLMFISADGQTTNNWFTTAQMQTFTNANHTDFSDVFLDRDNQILFVTQDEGGAGQFDRVLGISLITSNVIISLDVTNFGQLEGVSLTPDGKLLLAGEVNQFAIFEPVLGGLNSGWNWVNNSATNLPSVPAFPLGLSVGQGGAWLTNTYTATASLDFPSTGAQADTNLTISVTGAASGDVVELGVPTSALLAGTCFTAWASNNVVYVRHNNYSTTSKDPASGTFRAVVKKYR